jgi:hypothetical protein
MPKLSLSLPHSLAPDEAAARIRGLVDEMRAAHPDYARDIRDSWDGARGRFEGAVMGFTVSGEVAVTSGAVDIAVNYPFMASPFKGKIESMIRETGEKILGDRQ